MASQDAAMNLLLPLHSPLQRLIINQEVWKEELKILL